MVELRLPKALEHLANCSGGRYRLSCPVVFAYRGEEVAAQAERRRGATDVLILGQAPLDLDASWSFSDGEPRPDMEHRRSGPVIAVDLNHGHLAVCVLDPSGTRSSVPASGPLELTGLKASTRDGRITGHSRARLARTHGAGRS